MLMQVIAGSARRLLLRTLPGTETRPTSGQIKETLFNILQPETEGSRFLDLFAGSGGIGIEALSRGAKYCVFVDHSRQAVACIGENLRHTKLDGKARVMTCDAPAALRRLEAAGEKFDLVFLDPPYDLGIYRRILEILGGSSLLSPDALVIAEARREEDFSFAEDCGFTVVREKVYKSNKHVFLRGKETDHEP